MYDKDNEENCHVYVVVEDDYYYEITSDTLYLSGINLFVTRNWLHSDQIRKIISLIRALIKVLDQEFSLVCASAYSNMIVEIREEFVILTYLYLYFIFRGVEKRKLREYVKPYIRVLWEKYFKGIVDFETFYKKFMEKVEEHSKNFLKIRNLFSLHSEALYCVKQLLRDIGIPIDKENVKYIT